MNPIVILVQSLINRQYQMVGIEYTVSKENRERGIKLKEDSELASSGRIWIDYQL